MYSRSAGPDHAVGRQETHKHLALAPHPAVTSPPPVQHEGVKLHSAAAGDGTERMNRVPGTPSPSPQPRGCASSPTQRVSTACGGSSARKPQIGIECCPTRAGWAGSAPSTPAPFTSWFHYTHRCRLLVSERVRWLTHHGSSARHGRLGFGGVCSAGEGSRKACRCVRTSHPSHPPNTPLHAERVPTQPSQLNRHSSREARFRSRRSGSQVNPGSPPADTSSRWGARHFDCSTSEEHSFDVQRLPTAARVLPMLWVLLTHIDTSPWPRSQL
jgi:hypothetical protein